VLFFGGLYALGVSMVQPSAPAVWGGGIDPVDPLF
jgi:hypothetical protein